MADEVAEYFNKLKSNINDLDDQIKLAQKTHKKLIDKLERELKIAREDLVKLENRIGEYDG